MKLEVDDLIVLLLGAPASSPRLQGRIEGITRLEKLVFLLFREQELGKALSEDPDFRPHNFGPFSPKVYQAVADLSSYGLITDSARISDTTEDSWESENLIAPAAVSDPYSTRDFELTERGRRYYEALLTDLPPGSEEQLHAFKDRFAATPLRALVRYVYERHEDMTANSLIKREVLGD